MMSNPTVSAVMLTCNRQAMAERAIRSLRRQTYPVTKIILFDAGKFTVDSPFSDTLLHAEGAEFSRELSIGKLRNEANHIAAAKYDADIIVHADDDDWSHPRRIEEQVALLIASGKECVGYRDMLFYCSPIIGAVCGCSCHHDPEHEWAGPDCTRCDGTGIVKHDIGQAGEVWLYTNGNAKYCLGTSLCYWRHVWERRPFEDLPKGPTGEGEDSRWLREVDSFGVSSISPQDLQAGSAWQTQIHDKMQPRMIASVHGGNTSSMVALAIRRGASEMKRVPEWDNFCVERMAL